VADETGEDDCNKIGKQIMDKIKPAIVALLGGTVLLRVLNQDNITRRRFEQDYIGLFPTLTTQEKEMLRSTFDKALTSNSPDLFRALGHCIAILEAKFPPDRQNHTPMYYTMRFYNEYRNYLGIDLYSGQSVQDNIETFVEIIAVIALENPSDAAQFFEYMETVCSSSRHFNPSHYSLEAENIHSRVVSLLGRNHPEAALHFYRELTDQRATIPSPSGVLVTLANASPKVAIHKALDIYTPYWFDDIELVGQITSGTASHRPRETKNLLESIEKQIALERSPLKTRTPKFQYELGKAWLPVNEAKGTAMVQKASKALRLAERDVLYATAEQLRRSNPARSLRIAESPVLYEWQRDSIRYQIAEDILRGITPMQASLRAFIADRPVDRPIVLENIPQIAAHAPANALAILRKCNPSLAAEYMSYVIAALARSGPQKSRALFEAMWPQADTPEAQARLVAARFGIPPLPLTNTLQN
jgi:hypothetical protein